MSNDLYRQIRGAWEVHATTKMGMSAGRALSQFDNFIEGLMSQSEPNREQSDAQSCAHQYGNVCVKCGTAPDLMDRLKDSLSTTPPEAEADPDTAFELGRVSGYDEAMREIARGGLSNAPTVRHMARRGGKNQSVTDRMLAQANEMGIRVEVIYPQDEKSEAQVQALTILNEVEPLAEVFGDSTAFGRAVIALRRLADERVAGSAQ